MTKIAKARDLRVFTNDASQSAQPLSQLRVDQVFVSQNMDESTPRINASYLENFQGSRVRLVGKVVQLRGDTAVVDSGGQITLVLNRVGLSLSLLSLDFWITRIEG